MDNVYPASPRRPVPCNLGGLAFDDPYAWLFEDSDAALAWQAEQDALTQNICRGLQSFAPLRDRIRAQLSDRFANLNRPQTAAGRTFTVDRNDANTAPCIRVADNPAAPGRQLVDLDGLDENGKTPVVIILMDVSPDGKWIAVATAQEGEHSGSWRVADAQTGHWLPFLLTNQTLMNAALPGWLPDTGGFLLHDRNEAGLHRIRHHQFVGNGTVRPERVFTAEEVSALAPGLTVQVSPRGRWAVAVSEPHHRAALAVCDLATGQWRPFLPDGWDPDVECHGEWLNDDIYVAAVSDTAERGRVVSIPAATSQDRATWSAIVAPSEAVIRALTVVAGKIVVGKLVDISLAIDVVDPYTHSVTPLDVPVHSMSMIVLVPRRFPRSETLIVPISSFVENRSTYHFDIATGQRTLIGAAGMRWDGITVLQRFATAEDGVRIPYFIIHRSDIALDQVRPLLMHGYGGFNAAWLPRPLEENAVFIEEGGIYVHANLRGGGEYGASWWKGGTRANLQRSFDDLYVVAEDVIAAGLSEPAKMAFVGFSHGGLLAGAALTQRPDLWRVVCPTMPVFDLMEMRRAGDHGAAVLAYLKMNYGDANSPEEARYLIKSSPYHLVEDGLSYPTVYALFGENDLGCAPWQGRKFIARLQTADPDGNPHLLRVWKNVAHGTGDLDVAAEQYAEWMGLMMHELGMGSPNQN